MIDLSKPIRSKKIRVGFQPHWRTVFIYKCEKCGREMRIFASRGVGKHATPEIGGTYCICEGKQP